jgi:hypothetical protein
MTVMIPAAETNNSTQRPKTRLGWFWDVVLIVILLAGAYLRTVGMNWDGNQHLHPDERFLTMVESAMTPVKDLAQYFNTDASTLNPHNIGYSYYVYGTLPIFIVRYVAEGLGQTGYDQVNIVGRYTSAFLDWSTILLVYFTAKRLFKNRQVGILAAAFSAFSVLPIQLSHFFAVDTFVNFFSFLAFYFAVRVMTPGDKQHQQLSTDFFNNPNAE